MTLTTLHVVYNARNFSKYYPELWKKTCVFSKVVALNNQNKILDSTKNANTNEQTEPIVAPSSVVYLNKTIDEEINKQTIQLW